MNFPRLITVVSLSTLLLGSLFSADETGSAIFIHPDGMGLGHWNAARLLEVGPDGMLNWDTLEQLAAYRVHQKNWLSTTSHAGATAHAYGKKVHHNSYGMDQDKPLTALSGKPLSIMQEAMASGIRVGVVNSGHIGEPGTGVFLASTDNRYDFRPLARKIMESGADLIFCAGEIYLIPVGTIGKHGREGTREDGRNLLEEAEGRGYTVIFTREELFALDPKTEKVIGIFAAENTYNDKKENVLKKAGLETYDPEAPTFAEMTTVALKILGSDPQRQFFLVAEEEGTDNFSNNTNAKGMLDAAIRADKAIGAVVDFMNTQADRKTLLIVGADSDAGSPSIWAPRGKGEDYQLPKKTNSGAELDGPEGTGGTPFFSKPDQFGNAYPFGISWANANDYQGSAITRAHGFNSQLLGTNIDNSGIYRIFYEVLFGVTPEIAASKLQE
ncbi:alkaline phosphatase [Puniceicoccales bacterium CK1056]|uniref:Alkaline phosphatase n=1 Tax=Oceanipulchritudo coccoides TaxID=2706888 RepID=A0A6B2LYW6_9BACT|nr:alkaline phosphatase [Oceanipulchritudo coccoides]NDV61818.1 alkaline phosphatase [Oceanipulchritudo coccoides]